MKRVFLLFTLLCIVSVTFAQRVRLTAVEQASLKVEAVKKINSFQQSCKMIADTDIPYYEKTAKGGYIEVALMDFLEDAQIEITSLDGKSSSKKSVERYLKRLAVLSRDRYKEIDITSFDCTKPVEFVPDVNRGADWFVGVASVVQVFRGKYKGEVDVEVSDKVVRTFKVHARRGSLIDKGGKVLPYWDIKLGNIFAKYVD